jgi:nitrogen-specific signal transduction histidine kinase
MAHRYDAAWYQDVLNAMRELVLVKGPDSHVLWANQSFLDYYGMTQDALHALIDADHSDPDDTQQYIKDDLSVVQTAAPLDVPQETITDAAGNCRTFHTIKCPIIENDKVARVVGVSRLLRDGAINKRDVDHNDAKAFVGPIRSLAENFPNPMLMVDGRKRLISSSPLWNAHFGGSDIRADSFFDEVHGDLAGLCLCLDECLLNKSTAEVEVHTLCPDGVARVFSARISPWNYRDGSSGGATIVATDVTALHHKAAELNRVNEELMQFSYRASHDLKGPLSTVKGLAKFIALDVGAGDKNAAISSADKIQTVMGNLEKSVISFLDLARADMIDTENEIVDLDQTVSDICAGLDHQISNLGVAIETDLAVCRILGQPVRIGQILENLISNAVKYHDPNKNDKRVKIQSGYAQQGAIQLMVKDNGCGIPVEAKQKIFDSFSRFHASSEGTGLGLAIVKKHVEALKGQINVENTGDGTLFMVTLPSDALELAS